MIRRYIALTLVAAGLLVSACNTVDGAKEDARSAGDAIENAVD